MAKGLKIPVYASFSMAFALMGDAFLYSFLPVNGASVQVYWCGLVFCFPSTVLFGSPDWTPIYVISVVAAGLTLLRISATLLAPLGGWLADRYGLTTIFSYSLASVIGGMLLLASGWTLLGAGLIFTLGNIQSSLAAATGAAGREDVARSVA